MEGTNLEGKAFFSDLGFRLHWRKYGCLPVDGSEPSWVALGCSWLTVPGQETSFLGLGRWMQVSGTTGEVEVLEASFQGV